MVCSDMVPGSSLALGANSKQPLGAMVTAKTSSMLQHRVNKEDLLLDAHVFLGSSKPLPHFGLDMLVDCGTSGAFSVAGVGGQLGQMLLRPQKEGENVTE